MRRFFVPEERLGGAEVTIEGDAAHRISRVLRMSPGDQVTLLDGKGKEYRVALKSLDPKAVLATVIDVQDGINETPFVLVLCQGLMKGSKFDWVLEKGTELGFAEFFPMVCHRSVPRSDEKGSAVRQERWKRIVREAAEQSQRSVIPQVHEITGFNDALESLSREGSPGLIPWEKAQGIRVKEAIGSDVPGKIYLFIGPEGGFEDWEVEEAKARGVVPVSLGRRILRAETAGLVAGAALLCAMGEL